MVAHGQARIHNHTRELTVHKHECMHLAHVNMKKEENRACTRDKHKLQINHEHALMDHETINF